MSITIGLATLLKITRNAIEKTCDNGLWDSIVSELQDEVLLKVTRELEPKELEWFGFYAIANNKHRFVKWWLNRNALPKPTTEKGLLNMILALHLFRVHHVPGNPTNILLSVYKSKLFRKVYPNLLKLEPETAGDRYNVSDSIKLRDFLVEMAVSIPGGTTILYNEWKRHTYNINNVWKLNFNYKHELNYNGTVAYARRQTLIHTSIQRLCQYGNVKDLKIALKHSEWWSDIPLTQGGHLIDPFTSILKNKNLGVFKYFMELVWSIKSLTQVLPYNLARVVWEQSWVNTLLKIVNPELLKQLNKIKIPKLQYKVKVLNWLLPEYFGVEALSHNLSVVQKRRWCLELGLSPYHNYVKENPVHANPEDLLWIETQEPFITPKADGLRVWDFVPSDYQPCTDLSPYVSGERIEMESFTLLLAFDANSDGNWQQRMESISKYHSHWNGPYKSLEDENADLAKFMDHARENRWEKVWWPKGVYKAPRSDGFFLMLDTPPQTPYPNDGWIVCGNNGVLLKVKPRSHLTVDVNVQAAHMYDSGLDSVRPRLPREECTFKNGIWRCEWDSARELWKPVTPRTDKETANTRQVIEQLTRQHQYPWSPRQLIPFQKRIYYQNERGEKYPEIQALFKEQRTIVHKIRSNSNFRMVFSLGGGYKNVDNEHNIDLDPYIISELKWYHPKQDVVWADATTMTSPITGEVFYQEASNYIARIDNAIHYFAKTESDWNNFLNNVRTRCSDLEIVMLDADLLFANSDTYTFPDSSTMKKGGQLWTNGVWDCTSQLKWRGGHNHVEPVVSASFIKESLTNQGWECIKDVELPGGSRFLHIKRSGWVVQDNGDQTWDLDPPSADTDYETDSDSEWEDDF